MIGPLSGSGPTNVSGRPPVPSSLIHGGSVTPIVFPETQCFEIACWPL